MPVILLLRKWWRCQPASDFGRWCLLVPGGSTEKMLTTKLQTSAHWVGPVMIRNTLFERIYHEKNHGVLNPREWFWRWVSWCRHRHPFKRNHGKPEFTSWIQGAIPELLLSTPLPGEVSGANTTNFINLTGFYLFNRLENSDVRIRNHRWTRANWPGS